MSEKCILETLNRKNSGLHILHLLNLYCSFLHENSRCSVCSSENYILCHFFGHTIIFEKLKISCQPSLWTKNLEIFTGRSIIFMQSELALICNPTTLNLFLCIFIFKDKGFITSCHSAVNCTNKLCKKESLHASVFP